MGAEIISASFFDNFLKKYKKSLQNYLTLY